MRGVQGKQAIIVVLTGGLAFGCTKGVTPTVEATGVVLANKEDNEPRIAATGTNAVYVSSLHRINYSLDGGATFKPIFWNLIGRPNGSDIEQHDCADFIDAHHLGDLGDSGVTTSHAPVLVPEQAIGKRLNG